MTVNLHDFGSKHSLTLEASGLAADAAVVAAGHEPNGYFWEGLVQFAWPDIAERLDFDSEAGDVLRGREFEGPRAAQDGR